MKISVDVQRWLRNENGEAVEVEITDLKIDKTKERGQIRQIDHGDIAKKSGWIPSTAATWTAVRNRMGG